MVEAAYLGKSIPDPPEPNQNLRAALEYAEQDTPVFPCRESGERRKGPYWERRTLENGHLDATTDAAQIISWWSRWPNALIGMPTGSRSGYVIIDHDTYKPGSWSRADLERNLGPLTDTTTVRTGSGGLQYHYRHPGGLKGVPENILGPGVCIKAEGGYVILPPSQTTGVYKYISREPAELPKWCEELLQERTSKPQSAVKASGKDAARDGGQRLHVVDDGAPIPYGRRNDTLALIARRRHDGTQSLAEFTADLERINRERCQPPIGTHPEDHDPEEVARIAAAAHRLRPYHECGGGPSQDTLEALLAFEVARIGGEVWKGHRKGLQSRLKTLILHARRHGYPVQDGVAFSASQRQLALKNGCSRKTIERNLQRLEKEGYIRRYYKDREDHNKPGTIVLLTAQVTNVTATQTVATSPQEFAYTGGGDSLCRPAPWTAPRARVSVGVWDYGPEGREYLGSLLRMGKGGEACVDILEHSGGKLHYRDLAEVLGIARPRSLYRKGGWLSRLVEAGVVELSEGYIGLTEDWLDRYNARREADREVDDYQRDMKRYNRDREKYRLYLEAKEQEREERRKARLEYESWVAHGGGAPEVVEEDPPQPAAGFMEELEKIAPEPEIPELTDEEFEALSAIEEYEGRYGAGSFSWTEAGYKPIFYQGERVVWPTQAQLERIAAHLDAAGERRVA